MLRTAQLVFITLTLGFSLNVAAIEKTWLDTEFVERAFIHVALRNEYSQGSKPLVKWNQPIKIWVQHKVADQALHDELTDAHLRHLATITGHSIERVERRQQANIVWLFTQESEWLEDIERELGNQAVENAFGAICKAGYQVNRNGVLSHASIIIPVDQAREHGKLLACIVEEITQVLGLPNDTEQAFPSIFNDETPEDLLSPLDVVLLKLLYEPELKPGMNEKQVTPIIRKLLRQYEKDGTLKGAVSTAKQGELFQLVGY